MNEVMVTSLGMFLSSFVSTACYCCFSLAFWGMNTRRLMLRTITYAVITAVYTDLSAQLLPITVHLVNALLAYFILFALFFRPLSLKDQLKAAGLSYFSLFITEVIVDTGILMFMNQQEMLASPFLMAALLWPPALILAYMAYIMRKRAYYPGIRLSRWFARWNQYGSLALLLFLLLQFFVLIMIHSMLYDPSVPDSLTLTTLLFIVSGLSLFIIGLAIHFISKTKDAAARATQELYIEDVNRMFTTIRGQRHDFVNHVQVIQSFLKLKKYDELSRYAMEMTGEIVEVNEIVSIGHPALSALVQAKTVLAEAKKIRFSHSFTGMEKLTLGMKSVDIVKIMGNLIDNAFDESAQLDPDHRWVEVRGWVENDDLWMLTRNSGRELSDDDRSRIFNPGFTTKAADGHTGIGLSVVKERVEYYKGAVQVESSLEKGTVFTIRIPLKARLPYKREASLL